MRRPFTAAFLLLSAAFTATVFIAPATLPPSSATRLDGAANWVDHGALWRSFPPLARWTYAVGDLVCHQRESRSLHLNGNQLPLDARMTALLVSSTAGLFLAWRLPDRPTTSATLVEALPRRLASRTRMRLTGAAPAAVWLLAFLTPLAIDGTLQATTAYESSTAVRLATGALAGLGGGAWLGAAFDALARPPEGVPGAASSSASRHG